MHTPGPLYYRNGAIYGDSGQTIAQLHAQPGLDGYTERDEYGELFAAAPETAAERDRLKENNKELLGTLKQLLGAVESWQRLWLAISRKKAGRAIAKATCPAAEHGAAPEREVEP